MNEYLAVYERRFVENLRTYAGMRGRIKRRVERLLANPVERLLANPYANTELLSDLDAKLNLRGCRSARVDRNCRIIFVICEECRVIAKCEYCFCDGLADRTVVFLTVGTHDVAYAMK